jgi:cobyrinic acid a,c-diamide synthase
MTPKRLLIAGANSGVGKTTLTMGLIAALRRRGLRVQPFKAGPDYIDPTYHTLAAGLPCRNIDTWMVPPHRALHLFNQAARSVDLALIEGVMGLFDGFSYESEAGSSAEIAKLVGAPVLLVIDVGKMARSAGAIARGYADFDSNLALAGFILNRCGSEGHYQGVKLAVEQATQRPVVGWLPKNAELHIPERHLGLVPIDERGELSNFITRVADLIDTYFDLDHIIELAAQAGSLAPQTSPERCLNPPNLNSSGRAKIGVARDAAFSFYYEDNLDLLRQAGAEIVFFSPQTEASLPPGLNGLYLGGGFPEMHAAQLAANLSLRESIRQAHAAGLPIYAECGGLMYLSEAIIDLEGRRHEMVGLVPGLTRMQPRLISLGYRLVESPTGNFLLPPGRTTRGHEFHWSLWETQTTAPAWLIQPRRSNETPRPDGYADGHLIASYVHLHFAHDPQIAVNFVKACQ